MDQKIPQENYDTKVMYMYVPLCVPLCVCVCVWVREGVSMYAYMYVYLFIHLLFSVYPLPLYHYKIQWPAIVLWYRYTDKLS